MDKVWLYACINSQTKSFNQKLVAAYSTGGIAVRFVCFRLVILSRQTITRLQIAAYILCAVANAFMHVQWRRLDADTKDIVWRYYGDFTRLMVAGSVFGAAASLCYMMTSAFNIRANDYRQKGRFEVIDEMQDAYADSSIWQSFYFIFYSLAFMMVTFAQLMILNRLLGFIQTQTDVSKLDIAKKTVLATVIVGNIVGLAGNAVAATYSARASSFSVNAAAAWRAAGENRSQAYADAVEEQGEEQQMQSTASSVQNFSEVVVLLTVIAAFAASGSLALRRLRLFRGANSEAGAKLRRKVALTVFAVFVSFLLRAIMSIMLAVSGVLSNVDTDTNICKNSSSKRVGNSSAAASFQCSECYNVYTYILVWFLATPEFYFSVIIISAPVASLVALWGMTSERMLNFIYFSQKSTAKRDPERTLSTAARHGANVSIPQRAGSDKSDS
jgi:hypothetical protein